MFLRMAGRVALMGGIGMHDGGLELPYACGMAKLLTAFARHAGSRDGHCHDCRDCAKTRRCGRAAD